MFLKWAIFLITEALLEQNNIPTMGAQIILDPFQTVQFVFNLWFKIQIVSKIYYKIQLDKIVNVHAQSSLNLLISLKASDLFRLIESLISSYRNFDSVKIPLNWSFKSKICTALIHI